jgi:hypothetical protein
LPYAAESRRRRAKSAKYLHRSSPKSRCETACKYEDIVAALGRGLQRLAARKGRTEADLAVFGLLLKN